MKLKKRTKGFFAFCGKTADIFTFIYIALICMSRYYRQKSTLLIVLSVCLVLMNAYLRIKHGKQAYHLTRNRKVILSSFILAAVYIALMYTENLSVISAVINLLALVASWGMYSVFVNVVSAKFVEKKREKPDIFLVRAGDILKDRKSNSLLSVNTYFSRMEERNNENANFYDMIYKFCTITYENNYGFNILRSAGIKEDGIERFVVRTKRGCQIIIRGRFDKIKTYCSDICDEKSLKPFESVSEEVEEKIGTAFSNGIKTVCCAFSECKDLAKAESLNSGFTFVGWTEEEIKTEKQENSPVCVCECEDSDNVASILSNSGWREFECSPAKLEEKAKLLKKKGIICAGEDSACSINTLKPVPKKILSVSGDFEKVTLPVFSMCFMALMFTLAVFASLLNVLIFSGLEIMFISGICMVSSFCVLLFGKTKEPESKDFVVTAAVMVICTVLSFIAGRYIMGNQMTEGDKFMYSAARSMSFVCFWFMAAAAPVITAMKCPAEKGIKAVLPYMTLIISLILMLIPQFFRIFELYRLSYWFVQCSVLTAIAGLLVIKLTGKIKIGDKNGKQF